MTVAVEQGNAGSDPLEAVAHNAGWQIIRSPWCAVHGFMNVYYIISFTYASRRPMVSRAPVFIDGNGRPKYNPHSTNRIKVEIC